MKFRAKGAILAVLIFLATAVLAPAITLEGVSNELVCQCGCGLVLNNCNHSDCGVAIPMREIIKEKLAIGETTEQIVEYFVTEYGEVVLAAPTRQGFNLTVWILPFLGIIVGGIIITVVIIFWTRRRHQALVSEDTHESHADIPDKYEETFDRELEDFE